MEWTHQLPAPRIQDILADDGVKGSAERQRDDRRSHTRAAFLQLKEEATQERVHRQGLIEHGLERKLKRLRDPESVVVHKCANEGAVGQAQESISTVTIETKQTLSDVRSFHGETGLERLTFKHLLAVVVARDEVDVHPAVLVLRQRVELEVVRTGRPVWSSYRIVIVGIGAPLVARIRHQHIGGGGARLQEYVLALRDCGQRSRRHGDGDPRFGYWYAESAKPTRTL